MLNHDTGHSHHRSVFWARKELMTGIQSMKENKPHYKSVLLGWFIENVWLLRFLWFTPTSDLVLNDLIDDHFRKEILLLTNLQFFPPGVFNTDLLMFLWNLSCWLWPSSEQTAYQVLKKTLMTWSCTLMGFTSEFHFYTNLHCNANNFFGYIVHFKIKEKTQTHIYMTHLIVHWKS